MTALRGQVDVIIPSYNSAQYLPQAIESALAQDHAQVRVLVVDDGSTDNTRGIVASYKGRVDYHYQDNEGLGSARNAGFGRTHGDYVCFLDADDVILPRMISDQLKIFDRQPETGICHGKTLMFNGDRIYYPVAETWRPARHWDDYLEPLSFICAFHLGSSLIRREVMKRFGPFDENPQEQGCEDWALQLRAAVGGTVFSYVPRVHGLYRQHPGSMSAEESMIVRRETALLKYAARLMQQNGAFSPSQRRMLGLGIAAGAVRARANSNPEIEYDLKQLTGLTHTDPKVSKKPFHDVITASNYPACVSYLALSAALHDLKKNDLAAVMFIKCGDLAICQEESHRYGHDGLFRDVMERMRALRLPEADRVPEEWVDPKSSIRDSSGEAFFHALEAMIPHHASFHSYVPHALGRHLQKQGEHKKAESEFRTAIKLNPNGALSHLGLGISLLHQCSFRTAIEQLEITTIVEPHLTAELLTTKMNATIVAILGRKSERFDGVYSANGVVLKSISFFFNILLRLIRRIFPVNAPSKQSSAKYG